MARALCAAACVAMLAGCFGRDDVSGRPSMRRNVIGRELIAVKAIDEPRCRAAPIRYPAGTRFVVVNAFRAWGFLDSDWDGVYARPTDGRRWIYVGRWVDRPGGARLIVDPLEYLVVPNPPVAWFDCSAALPDGSAASRETLDAIVRGDARDGDVALAAVYEMTRRARDATNADHAWAIDRLARLADASYDGDGLQDRYAQAAIATLESLPPDDLRPVMPRLRAASARDVRQSPGFAALVGRVAATQP